MPAKAREDTGRLNTVLCVVREHQDYWTGLESTRVLLGDFREHFCPGKEGMKAEFKSKWKLSFNSDVFPSHHRLHARFLFSLGSASDLIRRVDASWHISSAPRWAHCSHGDGGGCAGPTLTMLWDGSWNRSADPPGAAPPIPGVLLLAALTEMGPSHLESSIRRQSRAICACTRI